MKKKRVTPILFFIAIFFMIISGGLIYNSGKKSISFSEKKLNTISTPASLPTQIPETPDFTASFEIIANGTKRIFTDSMYHSQSPDVYIENPNPSIIHIKKSEVTWDDFFKTLPFSLTPDCLVTGTKQTFCSTETKKLRFFLNGVETPNALEKEMKANDHLSVTYGS